MELSEEELRLWDPEQYQSLYSKSAEEQPNYIELLGISELEREELLEEISTSKMITVGSVEDED